MNSLLSLLRINWLLLHKARLAALSAYGYQAVAALVLILVVSRLLPPGEYATYSLVIATAQLAALGAFDWVRFAATRFYPGIGEDAERREKATLAASFLAMAGMGLLAALVFLAFGVSVEITVAGAIIAAGQGGTDLQLTMSRCRGGFALFASTQFVRASALSIGGIGGALLTGSALGAMAGVIAGYGATIAFVLLTDRMLRETDFNSASSVSLRDYLRYGFPAAGASVVHLGSAVVLRYAVSIFASPAAVPGMLLAIDLVQRPFALGVAALHDVIYPSVVAAHDRGDKGGERAALLALYGLEFGSIIFLSTLLIGFSGLISDYVAGASLRAAFFAALPLTTVLMALRIVLTAIVATPFHLAKRSGALALIAAADFLTTSGALLIAGAVLDVHSAGLLLAGVCAAVTTIIFSQGLRLRWHSPMRDA
ncbi:MAG: hypothetical protein ACK4TP_13075 [Hyphomicrobium sp.]